MTACMVHVAVEEMEMPRESDAVKTKARDAIESIASAGAEATLLMEAINARSPKRARFYIDRFMHATDAAVSSARNVTEQLEVEAGQKTRSKRQNAYSHRIA